MNLSDLEQHVFAYFVANGAEHLDMVPRAWPYGELLLIVEDKVQFATREFGFEVTMACARAARAFLDLQIDREGFSSVENDFGGTMHRYQRPKYLKCVKELQATNSIIRKAQAAGPGYWETVFAELTDRNRPIE